MNIYIYKKTGKVVIRKRIQKKHNL
jgi:hypothetical protein